jgi:hypothetical protein
LYLVIPVAGVPGLSAVVPDGIVNAPVAEEPTTPDATTVVDVTDVNPANVVAVAPKLTDVLPIVTAELVS